MPGFFVQRLLQFNFSFGTGSYGAGPPQNLSITAASSLAGTAASAVTAGTAPAQAQAAAVAQQAASQMNNGQPLRALVHVEFANLPTTGIAQMRIWGLTLDHMNQLSKAGLVYAGRNNTVTVKAGDTENGMVTVFHGNIVEAYPDMNAQPETSFYIMASPTNDMQLKPAASSTYPNAVAGSTILSQLAAQAGYTLENNGVDTQLQSPHYSGTVWQQIRRVVDALDCFATVDGVNKVIAIWPKGGSRAGQPHAISPETGMIGYPSFQLNKVMLRVLFSPSYIPQVGKRVQVKSQLQGASGTFTLIYSTLDLACNIPDGPWDANLTLAP
jgi:hypothetical protein